MRTTPAIVGLMLLSLPVAAWCQAGAKDPALAKAIEDIASPDEAVRTRAAGVLQAAMAGQAAAMAAVDTPEQADRVAAILERHVALTAYAREVLALPPAEAREALAWGLADARISAIAAAYSGDSVQRALAAEQVGAQTGKEADRILARLIRDRDWNVGSAAVDVARGRPESPAVVDALWDRAVERGINVRRPLAVPKVVEFRGKKLRPAPYDNALAYATTTDPEAAEVLASLKSPLVEQKLVAYFGRLVANAENTANAHEYAMYFQPTQNAIAMIEATKSKAVVPVLMRLLEAKENNKQSVKNPGMEFFASSRTLAMTLIIRLTDQDADAYGLKQQNNFMPGMWVATDEKTHRAAEAKLKTWYATNKAPFEAAEAKVRKDAPIDTATRPAAEAPKKDEQAPTRKPAD